MPGPIQPSRQGATWSFVIADRNLANLAFLTPHPEVVRYTRRDSDYCEIAIQVKDRDDLNALEAAAYSKVLRAWRNGVNRFNGEFVELRETGDSWELVAKDPFYNLNWRDVRASLSLTGDAGQVAWDLVALQNSYFDTHLRQGTLDLSEVEIRQFKFKAGERASSAIKYLTALEGSFSFTINGYDGPPDEWATFRVHYPTSDNLLARFEYGNGTIGNCDDYLRESLPLVNRANVVGESPNLIAISQSVASPWIHGLWEGDRGQVLTSDLSQLREIADGSAYSRVQYDITMSCTPEAPQLFTDFDVGQRVSTLIRRSGGTIQGLKKVKEATVLLDTDSGAEELESITLLEESEVYIT